MVAKDETLERSESMALDLRDDFERLERIERMSRTAMPVSAHGLALRSSHKTQGSRHASRKFSRVHGGSHRRRLKLWR
jgi:hypothetical protein